jgi:hypothetical protein
MMLVQGVALASLYTDGTLGLGHSETGWDPTMNGALFEVRGTVSRHDVSLLTSVTLAHGGTEFKFKGGPRALTHYLSKSALLATGEMTPNGVSITFDASSSEAGRSLRLLSARPILSEFAYTQAIQFETFAVQYELRDDILFSSVVGYDYECPSGRDPRILEELDKTLQRSGAFVVVYKQGLKERIVGTNLYKPTLVAPTHARSLFTGQRAQVSNAY